MAVAMLTRSISAHDWKKVALLASGEAQEGEHDINLDWVERRHGPGERKEAVVENEGDVVAYCAIERLESDEYYRAFLVMDWTNFNAAVAEAAYEMLEKMINEKQLQKVWMREMAGDLSLISFIQGHGFVISKRYEISGHGMVNLLKRF